MNSDSDCLICRKQRGDFPLPGGPLYADDRIFICHAHFAEGQQQAYLGWLILESRRHVPGLGDLTNAEAQAVGLWQSRLARALQAVAGAEHVYSFVIGHGVPHFHLHLLPRYPGTPGEYWGVRVDEWPDAPQGGTAEITALLARIKMYLSSEQAGSPNTNTGPT